MKFFIISYVFNLERRKYVAVWFSYVVKNSMFTNMIFIYSWIWSYDQWWPTQWPHSVKRLRMCEIVCWKKAHVINKNINGSYAKTTHRRIQQALCKNWKRWYTDLLHFSTGKHNLVSFFGRIVFWQYNCIVVFYIFFFSGENARWYLFLN